MAEEKSPPIPGASQTDTQSQQTEATSKLNRKSSTKRSEVWDHFTSEIGEAYKSMYQPQVDPSRQKDTSSSHPEPLQKKSRFILGDKFTRHKIESGEVESKCDLDVYLKKKVLVVEKGEFDILMWCKLNQNRFLILSHLARDVLAMPISMVASKSAFSMCGRVLDEYRSSLTPKIVEALICAQDWLRKQKQSKTLEESLEDLEKMEEVECGDHGDLEGNIGVGDHSDEESEDFNYRFHADLATLRVCHATFQKSHEDLKQENNKLKKSVGKLKKIIKELLSTACFSSDEE
ncbi:hypothetical protein DH2020_028992 [Rehmannia glutinosa]|uniref:HAT C-terminal dimerisation domain-containing protein n=1 Tax=Rehmannia glutinosa TaxID=99300 RepID=A0ABR0VTJ4_REHGL